jgi:hypothetical protein
VSSTMSSFVPFLNSGAQLLTGGRLPSAVIQGNAGKVQNWGWRRMPATIASAIRQAIADESWAYSEFVGLAVNAHVCPSSFWAAPSTSFDVRSLAAISSASARLGQDPVGRAECATGQKTVVLRRDQARG